MQEHGQGSAIHCCWILVDTHPFPPVLLIAQLERSAISHGNEIRGSIKWEAMELAKCILLEI
jgi:hypothetical protein